MAEKNLSSAWGWTAGVLGAVLVYALSLGPVAQHYRRSAPPQWVQNAYAPLVFAYKKCPPVKAAYDAYFKLIGVNP